MNFETKFVISERKDCPKFLLFYTMRNSITKYVITLVHLLLAHYFLCAQIKHDIKLPVFRQVSYPFLPPVTSDFFFFSQDGLMWFSSAQGLTSFDGSGVLVHSSPEQTNKYGLNFIHQITEDKNHNLYIGCGGGLVFFNRKTKQFSLLQYTYRNTAKPFPIIATSFFIDSDETVFIGSSLDGFFIYHPHSGQMEHLNLDASKPDKWEDRIWNTITSILPSPEKNSLLWIGSYNGIYSFDKKTKSFSKNFNVINPQYSYVGKERYFYDVEKMNFANDSTLWFNIWGGGFAEYYTHSGKFYIYTQKKLSGSQKEVASYVIPSFAKMNDSLYVLGITNLKPAVFNIKDKSLHFFSITPDKETSDQILYVDRDNKGNIWLIRNGMLYVSIPDYSRLQLQRLLLQDSSNYNEELRGIYFDSTDNKYYCSVRMSKGINVFDSNFNFVKLIPTPLFTNYYTFNQTCTDKITKDASGRFWVTGRETYVLLPGQEKFDYATKIFPSLSWLKSKEEFTDITCTTTGNILMQESETGNIYLIDHKTLQTDSIIISEIKTQAIGKIFSSRLCYDKARNFAYLSNDSSIIQYDVDKKSFREISQNAIFGTNNSSETILRYALDAEGRLWLVKDGYGIRIIDPQNLSCVDSIAFGTRGFMRAYFNDMSFGGPGRMFFKSLNGIVVYDYKKNQSFFFDNSNGLTYPLVLSMLYSHSHLIMGMHKIFGYYDLHTFAENNFDPVPQVNTIKADTAVVYTRENGTNKTIFLSHNQNTLTFSFSAPEFIFPERIEYAYMLEGVNKTWQYSGYFNRNVTYNNLSPGTYIFHLKAQMQEGDWRAPEVKFTVIIHPAWWQTTWFKILLLVAIILLAWRLIQQRITKVKKNERFKSEHAKELLELEAKALRSQMNPHFIFNCLNSIKSLIQKKEDDKAITYLTTFSKLIRTIFQNSDKREITLFDELEICHLYAQLESLRFGNKFSYHFNVDENLDLKSIKVPALIIQPFIENAIWHGIIPREEAGSVNVTVDKIDNIINCIIDDNGIGRDLSNLNKFKSGSASHESKGVKLTQSRLDLDNLLNERKASVDIIDKKDKDGKSTGTKIIIQLTEY